MRTIFTVILVLLVATFAVAQQDTNPSSVPGSQSQQPGTMPGQTQSQRPGTMPDQAAPPSMSAAAGDVIEGCLGGSSPNYTVTDKAGTTYQLQIPQNADASVLAKHIGESVQVKGTLDQPSATPGASSAHSIRVAQIGKGTGTCPAGSNSAKPPSK
jgi:hypothetical protein